MFFANCCIEVHVTNLVAQFVKGKLRQIRQVSMASETRNGRKADHFFLEHYRPPARGGLFPLLLWFASLSPFGTTTFFISDSRRLGFVPVKIIYASIGARVADDPVSWVRSRVLRPRALLLLWFSLVVPIPSHVSSLGHLVPKGGAEIFRKLCFCFSTLHASSGAGTDSFLSRIGLSCSQVSFPCLGLKAEYMVRSELLVPAAGGWTSFAAGAGRGCWLEGEDSLAPGFHALVPIVRR